MPRHCSICHHECLDEINRALVEGSAFPALIAEYRVSKDALSRHKANHLPAALAKAREVQEVAQADDLLEEVRSLQGRALTILNKAEGVGDLRTALLAIREARSNLELLGRLAGELQVAPQVNILIAPQVQQAIVDALYPYPEARIAVADALGSLEAAS